MKLLNVRNLLLNIPAMTIEIVVPALPRETAAHPVARLRRRDLREPEMN